MSKRLAILWFRRDLRLHDNQALTDALHHADEVMPVYIFDPREWRGTLANTGLPKIGSHRAKFILESVADLRKSLRAKGSDLIIRTGLPEDVLVELTTQSHANWVFCNRERTSEELVVQNAVEASLWTVGREVHYSRGKLLYHTSDLPFPITQVPDVFSQFRKETERFTIVRPPLPTPAKVPFINDEEMANFLSYPISTSPSLRKISAQPSPGREEKLEGWTDWPTTFSILRPSLLIRKPATA
jgi:deoxyribodipyrimidine photo-lyase